MYPKHSFAISFESRIRSTLGYLDNMTYYRNDVDQIGIGSDGIDGGGIIRAANYIVEKCGSRKHDLMNNFIGMYRRFDGVSFNEIDYEMIEQMLKDFRIACDEINNRS